MKTYVTKAGKFDVERIDCRHYLGPFNDKAPRAVVLHTTECTWGAALAEFKKKFAPHFLLGFDNETKKVRIAQLIPLGQTGAALEHHNELAVVQIEMVEFSKQQPWLPMPETLDALASLMLVIRDECDVPLTRPYKDGDYGMYGYNNHHRDKFGKEPGWFGHADVPDNSHWDPGNMEWSKVFDRAEELDKPSAPLVADNEPEPKGIPHDFDCEHCDGTGEKNGETCEACDGTGAEPEKA